MDEVIEKLEVGLFRTEADPTAKILENDVTKLEPR